MRVLSATTMLTNYKPGCPLEVTKSPVCAQPLRHLWLGDRRFISEIVLTQSRGGKDRPTGALLRLQMYH